MRRIWQNVLSIQYKIRGDDDLVGLARAGNPQAYDELVMRYRGRIYALVLGIVGDNEEDASEAIRDTFVSAYRNLGTVVPADPPRAWLFRHAVRAALARVQARRTRPVAYVALAKGACS